jgi:hypothetical protein
MQNKYPIGGYAPGNYTCICCICGKEFQGDKRAIHCELCAIKTVKTIAMEGGGVPDLMLDEGGPISPELELIYRILEQWGNKIEMPNMEGWLKEYAVKNAPTSAVWVKGAPKERKLYHARFIGHLSDFIHDGIIEPVSNPEYWQAIASGVRISIKAHHIVEYLDEAPSKESDAVEFDSKWLIGRVKERFNELLKKNWDWRSFYNGWIEGRADAIEDLLMREKLYKQSNK